MSPGPAKYSEVGGDEKHEFEKTNDLLVPVC